MGLKIRPAKPGDKDEKNMNYGSFFSCTLKFDSSNFISTDFYFPY
jgi:hypothetical protein